MAWTDRLRQSGEIRFEEGPITNVPPHFSRLHGMMQERDMETSDELFNLFTQMAPRMGDSSDFQRTLYESFTGQAAPDNYTGFHAGQVGRIQNVIDPQQFNIEAMEQIAILASLFREMQEQGGFQDLPGTTRRNV